MGITDGGLEDEVEVGDGEPTDFMFCQMINPTPETSPMVIAVPHNPLEREGLAWTGVVFCELGLGLEIVGGCFLGIGTPIASNAFNTSAAAQRRL